MYYFFQPLMIRNETLNFLILINTLLWVILSLYPLALLTSNVTKVVNEVEKTGNIIHMLLNRTINEDMKVELEQFSLQLLHRKVRFTANGYFILDNTFLQLVSKRD
ncbi:PREDICTED: putative gustatory receptor 28b [Eufriesea mexicana]|uniref:putative gustatory receptor 28b n=1 Tax=Eufriesea mexicana TaxID=516756 RepID=UPI00083BB1E6|nr:PREDICTED: putative gustatory receptor 28b [Eufriesea mexicana]